MDISLHKIGEKFFKIKILIKKLEFFYDVLQFSMLNPYAEWKFCRSFCDKKFVSFCKLLGDLPPPGKIK